MNRNRQGTDSAGPGDRMRPVGFDADGTPDREQFVRQAIASYDRNPALAAAVHADPEKARRLALMIYGALYDPAMRAADPELAQFAEALYGWAYEVASHFYRP